MTPELAALVAAAFAQFLAMGVVTALLWAQPGGLRWNLSPRDAAREPSLLEGRARRAEANHLNALLPFAVAVLTLAVSGQTGGWTALAAWAFVAARLLYLPAYVLGWVPWRSAIWWVGTTATTLLLLAALI